MAGYAVRVEDEKVQASLVNLRGTLGNMQSVLDAIGARLVNLAREGFTREQAPDGAPWKPLAASTQRSRARRGNWPGPILRVSGELFKSLGWKAGADSLEIGAGGNASGAYAAIQQFGGRVLRPMRRGVLRFKISKDGTSRFAKHSKANFEQDATFGGRPTIIPARPYLPTSGTLPDAYLATCLDIISQRMEAALRG